VHASRIGQNNHDIAGVLKPVHQSGKSQSTAGVTVSCMVPVIVFNPHNTLHVLPSGTVLFFRGIKDLVQKIMHWRHTGFNVHSKVRAETKEDTERVGKYMIRPILSLKRLSLHEGQVLYQYGKQSSETESMDYLEFIARVTSHIPDKGQVMVRTYGLYANAHRGKMRKKDADPLCPLIIKDEDPFIPSKGWAEMIKKVYGG